MDGPTRQEVKELTPDFAFTVWRRWRNRDDMSDSRSDLLEEIENYLLALRPDNIAACPPLIDVVLDSMSGGGRSDRKDIELLQHIKTVLEANA